MTALEIIQNRQSYDTKRKHNDFLNDTRIVTSNYEKLVRDALTDRCYSEMAHVYALSAALGIAIHSYYPPQLNPELSTAFTRNVCGRKVRVGSNGKISLMWTSVCVPKAPKEFQVNHFVPLVQKTSCVNITVVDLTCTGEENTPNSVDQQGEKFGEISEIEDSPDLSSVSLESGANTSLQCLSTSMHVHDEPWDRSDSDELYTSSTCPPQNKILDETKNQPDLCETEAPACSSKSDLPTTNSEKLQGKLENGYLDAGTISSLLLNNQTGLPRISGGLKENVYFILNNSNNVKRKDSKGSNKSSTFSDDCGVWDRDSTSPYSYYLLHDNGDLSTIFKRKTGYCFKKQV